VGRHLVGDHGPRSTGDEDHEAKPEALLVLSVEPVEACLKIGAAWIAVVALLAIREVRN
jgi:hypothetical protein